MPGIEAHLHLKTQKKEELSEDEQSLGPLGNIHHHAGEAAQPVSQCSHCANIRGQQDSQGSLNLFLPTVQHLQVIKAFPLLLLSSFHSSRGVYSKLF